MKKLALLLPVAVVLIAAASPATSALPFSGHITNVAGAIDDGSCGLQSNHFVSLFQYSFGWSAPEGVFNPTLDLCAPRHNFDPSSYVGSFSFDFLSGYSIFGHVQGSFPPEWLPYDDNATATFTIEGGTGLYYMASGVITGHGTLDAPLVISVSTDLDLNGLIYLPSDVPEPASWMLLIAGFGLTGAAMRRRGRSALRTDSLPPDRRQVAR